MRTRPIRRRWLKLGVMTLSLVSALTLMCAGCQTQSKTPAAKGPDCETHKARLVQLISQLPPQAMSLPIRVSLPTSTLGGSLGQGSVLEISERRVALDGVPIEGKTHQETIEQLRDRLTALNAARSADASGHQRPSGSWFASPSPSASPPPEPDAASSASPTPTEPESSGEVPSMEPPSSSSQVPSEGAVLYVAAAAETDLRTLQAYLRAVPSSMVPKLVFGAPPLPEDASLTGHDLPARVFAEPDEETRRRLAAEGYAQYSSCSHVDAAAGSVSSSSGERRWPALRQAMLTAVPKCQCEQLDSESLGYLLVAEQRSGGVAIGSLPIDFLRDERCAAAMPLRTVQQLLGDIEKFEEEFSGDWHSDALHFEEIITNERLLVYLCVALPGETLASMQRSKRTVFFKTPSGCQPWKFEPLSPGAPMGTWRREMTGRADLALHYRQFAEDLRLFGPLPNPESQPTDEGPFECSQDFHLDDIDEHSVGIQGGGRWFFSEEACRTAPPSDAMPAGCISELTSR